MQTSRDNVSLGCAGLAVAGTATNSQFKTANALAFGIGGLSYLKAATDNIAFTADTGTSFTNLAASQQSCFFFMIDTAGAITVRQHSVQPAAAAAGYRAGGWDWPGDRDGKACIGAVRISCNASGAFTPGTTALNAANQTATYYNVAGDLGVPVPF